MKYKIIIVAVLLVFCAAAPAVYYFRQYQKAQLKVNNPTLASQQEAKDTIVAVGKLMMLPEGEDPTVMQITDISKLKDQAFFAKAVNGDKVLIYTTAKKAILYRAETNKIIDVAPVNIGSTASATLTPKPTIKAASPSASPKK